MSELAQQIIAENIARYERGEDATYLDLGNCGLTELPEAIGQCTWVEVLVLSDDWFEWNLETEMLGEQKSQNQGKANRLYTLKTVELLSNLKKLIAHGDIRRTWSLYDLSPLSGLENLQSLDCSFTQVNDLKPLSRLENLKSLNCGWTQVQDLGPLVSLKNLHELNCGWIQIQDLSPLASLQNLKSLNCWSTKIQDLSPVASLQNLKSLYCGATEIQDISPLSEVKKLQEINLGWTKVQDLSPLSSLQKLKSLFCLGTQVQDITPLKGIIRQMEMLNLSEAPILYIPKEIYEHYDCAADLRAYWQALDESQITINQQLKVMFLGNGCVGKTTLLHWLLDGAFRPIPLEEGRTHGVIVQPHRFAGSEVMAHFWDFGGQEVYHATHRLFLGRRTLYLLVWATETPENAEELRHPPQYWLDMVADVADPHERSRVLVIQNRFEGQPERSLFSDEQRAAYEAQGLDIETFSVDAKGGKGVKPLLAAIQEAAEDLVDTYQEQLPQNWVDIRTAVAQRRAAGEKTLPMADFLDICQQAQSASTAPTVLGYLHRAGEVFHYAGRFSDQIILDQQWALKAVYAVLKRERIGRYAGKFFVSDLIGFWRSDDPQLTAEDAQTFLQFMLDNQTAFYAKDTERGNDPELIVPQLLPEAPPSIFHTLEDIPDRLQHRVAYRFLHRDIISRFIVRAAALSEQQEYWRQGIHIRYAQAKAAVFVANDAEGQPLLTIVSYGQGKEDLLQRIREELHQIRSLDKAQEYRFAYGTWQPYAAAPLGAKDREGGLPVPTPAPSWVDVQAFFEPLKIFVSYSKHDRKDYLEPLLNYLSPLVRGRWLTPWDDSQIPPGEEWDDTIRQEIGRADIILLLVSAHSLNTDYIWNVEIETAMQRHEAGTAWVVPVILSQCLWTDKDPSGAYIFPPAKLNALPAKGKPVSEWERREAAWHEVAQGVKRICETRKG